MALKFHSGSVLLEGPEMGSMQRFKPSVYPQDKVACEFGNEKASGH